MRFRMTLHISRTPRDQYESACYESPLYAEKFSRWNSRLASYMAFCSVLKIWAEIIHKLSNRAVELSHLQSMSAFYIPNYHDLLLSVERFFYPRFIRLTTTINIIYKITRGGLYFIGRKKKTFSCQKLTRRNFYLCWQNRQRLIWKHLNPWTVY